MWGDCDDTQATVLPDAEEACDGLDNDCDGVLPEGEQDADADGYSTCEWSEGWLGDTTVIGGLDCDDDEGNANPGLSEVCADGIDNDCDGTTNGCAIEGELLAADADLVLWGSEETEYLANGSGSSLAFGDIDGDGVNELVIGSFKTGTDHGSVYVAEGSLTANGSVASEAFATVEGAQPDDKFGRDVAVQDANKDGFDDVLVGAMGTDSVAQEGGAAYLFHGTTTGLDLIFTLDGSDADLQAGRSVALGDVDGDGAVDLLAGSEDLALTQTYAGRVWVISGPLTGSAETDDADATISGTVAYQNTGRRMVTADLDGDGLGDLLMATRQDVRVFTADVEGSVETDDADVVVSGLGEIFLGIGSADVNGDGYEDMLVGDGVYGSDARGAVYLFLGPNSGPVSAGSADATVEGEEAGDLAGRSVASSDVDADGHDDLIVGATYNGSSEEGAAYLVSGPISGWASLADAQAIIRGDTAQDNLGDLVCGGGDVDGDGYEDILIGAGEADDGANNAGAIYLFPGGDW